MTSTNANTTSSSTDASARSTQANGQRKPLPPAWNRLADNMSAFHDVWKYRFNAIYAAASEAERIGVRDFLEAAAVLYRNLNGHHQIEERSIFPLLARKLPQFSADGSAGAQHVADHRAIHDGLEDYLAYLQKCAADPSLYDPQELRKIMDSFRGVLFRHLDQEVADLGAESVYAAGFTLDELARIPL